MNDTPPPGPTEGQKPSGLPSSKEFPVVVSLEEFLGLAIRSIELANLQIEHRHLQALYADAQTRVQAAEIRAEAAEGRAGHAENRAEAAESRATAAEQRVLEATKAGKTDELTGLARRGAIMDALHMAHAEVANDRRQNGTKKFSILVGDIDHFKLVNDGYGHMGGDAVLEGVGAVLSGQKRHSDALGHFHKESDALEEGAAGRYGGEEFLVVLPNCNEEQAIAKAEKLRATIERRTFPVKTFEGEKQAMVTISFGVATFDAALDLTPMDFFNRADRAVYVAKESGRNCVAFNDNGNFSVSRGQEPLLPVVKERKSSAKPGGPVVRN